MCNALIYLDHFLFFVSAVSSCVSIFAFSSLVGVTVDITSSAVGLRNYAVTQELNSLSQLSRKRGKSSIRQCWFLRL